jgi:hypothetical protein
LHEPARRERTATAAARLQAILRQPATGTAAEWLWRALDRPNRKS